MPPTLLIAGLGYCARAVAARPPSPSWSVIGTVRDLGAAPADGLARIAFAGFEDALAQATHLLISAPPEDGADPCARWRAALLAAPHLRWIGYWSTVGVYGDANGARVFENTPLDPSSPRAAARIAAEAFWREIAAARAIPLDIMRLGGIYGPGRSALDQIRKHTARRTISADHVFSRIHRDDVARATWAAIATAGTGTRTLNLVDDRPTPAHLVIEHAAALLGEEPPPARSLAEAWPDMSPMARSFWSARRVIDNAATHAALQLDWLYPSYVEGLASLP